MSPELEKLLKEAARRPATEEELRQQRRGYVASEMAWGSDADEAMYRAALREQDKEKIAQLDAEAETRRQRALRWFDENHPPHADRGESTSKPLTNNDH